VSDYLDALWALRYWIGFTAAVVTITHLIENPRRNR